MLHCPFYVCGVVLSKATCPVSLPSALPSLTADSQESAQFLESITSCLANPWEERQGLLSGAATLPCQGILTSVLLATQDLPGDQPREQSGPDLRCYAFLCDISDVTAGTWFQVKAWDLSVQETCGRAPFAIQPSSEFKCPF